MGNESNAALFAPAAAAWVTPSPPPPAAAVADTAVCEGIVKPKSLSNVDSFNTPVTPAE